MVYFFAKKKNLQKKVPRKSLEHAWFFTSTCGPRFPGGEGGGVPLNHQKRFIGGKVPPKRAKFDKIRQRTLLDDLTGGEPPPTKYEIIQNTKGKHLEKVLLLERNPGG